MALRVTKLNNVIHNLIGKAYNVGARASKPH